MARKADPKDKFLKTAKTIIASEGWRRLSVLAVAKAAGVSVADAYKTAADKGQLLSALSEAVDTEVAERLLAEQQEENWRDRLFDSVMTRFDVMMPDRDVWRVIYYDTRSDITAWPGSLRRMTASMARLIEASDLQGSGGPMGSVRAAVLAGIYARVLPVWFDDAEDQAKTMAALDKQLRQLEGWSERLRRREPQAANDGARDSTDDPETEETVH